MAVISSGAAGLTAAHLLARSHHVALYAADGRFGGHAHTHARTAPLRRSFRHRTYPWCADLDRLSVPPRPVRPLARFDACDHFGGDSGTIRAGIRRHDIHLLRGLPVHPRPRSTPQKGTLP
ncbi:NAD(P)-binding protein [Streptomyces sp. NPDC058872]|uniref:NAD(P)-binding protein n=1 Tax=Streptomyces sp. NPDC058872 TaxID=3346661 RepID=UPI0036831B32